LKLLEEIRPDAVVLDPVLRSNDVERSIQRIRALNFTKGMPIVVLPTFHPPLTASAERAGATHMLPHSANPLGTLLTELSKALGMAAATAPIPARGRLDSHWQQATLSAVPGSLTALRQAFHEVVRDPKDAAAWRELLAASHAFAGQMTLLGENPITHLASAVEVTTFSLLSMPERLNSSVLRTMGQTIDFISTLWDKGFQSQPLDLSEFHVVIIEDEPGAREIIKAAMDMIGVNSDGMETPTACVAVLSSQPCDLIFLDINLPEMNGFEVCTRIRTLPLHEKTPIVFITGMVTFQNRVQSNLSGGSDFVGKPFNLAELGLKALTWLIKGRYQI
jgi:DNA-binding response OmpR family regulator